LLAFGVERVYPRKESVFVEQDFAANPDNGAGFDHAVAGQLVLGGMPFL
jgi:hypothetical protein